MARMNEAGIRVGMGTYRPISEDFLSLSKQMGVQDVLLTPHQHDGIDSVLPFYQAWSVDLLEGIRDDIEEKGLNLFAIEKMPLPINEILLEIGDTEEKISMIKKTIENVGAAGIPILGYSGHHFGGAIRTTRNKATRGGATVSAFNIDGFDESLLGSWDYSDEVTEMDVTKEVVWDRYKQFLNEVIPVARESGVILAVHPSDPPLDNISGVPSIFSSFEDFKKIMGLGHGSVHKLKLCLGCWSSMGEDIPTVIDHFNNDIGYVHFRDVVGTVPNFEEAFIDDPRTNYQEVNIVHKLREIGFDGVITPDHVPLMTQDSEWEFGGWNGRLFTVGYLKGLVNSSYYYSQLE